MGSRIVSYAVVLFYSLAALWVIPMGGVIGCGSSGGGGDDDDDNDDATTLSFSELMVESNEQHSTLTSDLSDYIERDQNLVTVLADDSSSNSAMISAADNYISAAEDLVDSLDTYSDLMTEYGSRLSSQASLTALKNQGAGSPDPLLAVQLGGAIERIAGPRWQSARRCPMRSTSSSVLRSSAPSVRLMS